MADIPTIIAGTAVVAAESLCNPPQLLMPDMPDPLALIVQVLASMNIKIPKPPTIPLPSPPCALD